MTSPAMILSWKEEGRAEGFAQGLASGMIESRREDLLKLLRIKYGILPPELTSAVRNEQSLDQLTRWFDATLSAPTLEAFAVLARS